MFEWNEGMKSISKRTENLTGTSAQQEQRESVLLFYTGRMQEQRGNISNSFIDCGTIGDRV